MDPKDPMAEDLNDQLLPIFREEAAENFDRLSGQLEELGNQAWDERSEVLEECLRIAHNMKGASAIVGLDSLSELTHRMEDVLAPFRESEDALPADLLTLLLESVTLSHRMAEGEDLEPQAAAQREELATWLQGATGGRPAREKNAPRISTVKAQRADDKAAASPKDPRPAAAIPAASSSVRVDASRLDRLMAQAGELLACNARMLDRRQRLETLQQDSDEASKALPVEVQRLLAPLRRELKSLLEVDERDATAFGNLTDRISTAMREIRMLPLTSMASFWRRIVREAAQEAGREVLLEIEVGQIELDKEILEALREPLLHLLRNAVDHGIEAPEERLEAGKETQGSIIIKAAMVGSQVQLTVQDDGRGIDPAKVAASAESKGLFTRGQLARMSHEETLNLLFSSGFSTREEVSRLSGRGVGLDVVSHRLDELGGEVRIGRGPGGQGTRFELKLPLSLLSTRGLLVRSGSTVCALPIESVDRTISAERKGVHQVDGHPVLAIEDADPLALRYLAGFLNQPSTGESKMHQVVVVTRGGSRLGLVVDEVLEEQEFVARQLPWNLEAVPGVGAAQILADGSVGIVIDVAFLFDGGNEMLESVAPVGDTIDEAPKVLVVDDSLTSRTLERNILRRAGYDVETAVDGEEAWGMLKDQPFDLVVSDVEMPVVDGLELTRRIRTDTTLQQLPVVLVTSLGNEEQVRQGSEAGADEYIVKGQFEQSKLLEAVSRHL